MSQTTLSEIEIEHLIIRAKQRNVTVHWKSVQRINQNSWMYVAQVQCDGVEYIMITRNFNAYIMSPEEFLALQEYQVEEIGA